MRVHSFFYYIFLKPINQNNKQNNVHIDNIVTFMAPRYFCELAEVSEYRKIRILQNYLTFKRARATLKITFRPCSVEKKETKIVLIQFARDLTM